MICPDCHKEVARLVVLTPTEKMCIKCALNKGVLTKEEVKLLRGKCEVIVNNWMPYNKGGGWDST